MPPEHRRRGIGTRALSLLEDLVGAEGRSTVQSTASWPYQLGADGQDSPGREFARDRGYALALGDVQSTLTLPVDPAVLDRLDEEIAGAIAGYRVHSWVGKIPDDLVERWAILEASLGTEAPTGDLDVEEQQPDVDAVRESEELIAAQRRLSFGALALSPDGSGAAYSQLMLSTDGNAYQWGTLVRTADRGHRLGIAVKLANLRALHREAPTARAVYTYNAESNTHMRAVNALFGFVPTERLGELQKRLS